MPFTLFRVNLRHNIPNFHGLGEFPFTSKPSWNEDLSELVKQMNNEDEFFKRDSDRSTRNYQVF